MKSIWKARVSLSPFLYSIEKGHYTLLQHNSLFFARIFFEFSAKSKAFSEFALRNSIPKFQENRRRGFSDNFQPLFTRQSQTTDILLPSSFEAIVSHVHKYGARVPLIFLPFLARSGPTILVQESITPFHRFKRVTSFSSSSFSKFGFAADARIHLQNKFLFLYVPIN